MNTKLKKLLSLFKIILPQGVEFHPGYQNSRDNVYFPKLPQPKFKGQWDGANWALIGG